MLKHWDWQHWLIVLGSTAAGGAMGYFQSQTPVSLVDAVSGGWPTLRPMVFGAAMTAMAAIMGLYKTPPGPPTGPSVAGRVGLMALLLFVACTPGQLSPVAPVVAPVACVVADALRGDSIAQIVADCGASVIDVVIRLLSSKDPAILSSPAATEARALKAAVEKQ